MARFRRFYAGLARVCRRDRYVALGRENRQGRFDDVILLAGDPGRAAVGQLAGDWLARKQQACAPSHYRMLDSAWRCPWPISNCR